MKFSILQKEPKKDRLFILGNINDLKQVPELDNDQVKYVKKAVNEKQSLITINQYDKFIFIYILPEKNNENLLMEDLRRTGATVQATANKHKLSALAITNLSNNLTAAYTLGEGIALANYQFLKYKSDKQENSLNTLSFTKQSITVKEVQQLTVITEATYHTRTLVNEPLAYLTATQLAKDIAALGKEAGLKVTTLNKARLEKEKMGGILAVNRGSIDPPTFTIIEHKPKKAINKKPIVLVGKGVVYDTGGLSLKPTPASMDRMKSDMSGAALVTGTMYAVGKMQLPLHVIALVPATDNRPGENAYVPGDVVTMYSGSTVEVLNTDAEGRMLLADALHWAKRYEPELVMDFATLTGSAALATGSQGIVCMGSADDNVKDAIMESGNRQHERLVEFPLWDEYGELLKSDIADMKNVGGRYAGAITAGKFLQHFTDYPWMHFDIAGVSFELNGSYYHTPGARAFGLRMAIDFLMHYAKH